MMDEEHQGLNPLRNTIDLTPTLSIIKKLKHECSKIIIGQEELIDLLIIGILADGHILLEGVPGIAKTLSAKVLSRTLDAEFARIQFTPDLMPSDIIGTSIFNLKESKFQFKEGPIFANIILIDEINRAPAKTQAALFEVMEERQITFDGTTTAMEFPFLVIATQNPIEQEGTYRLPEGQLDRFIMKINLSYPSPEEEIAILQRFKNQIHQIDLEQVDAVVSREDLQKIHQLLSKIYVEDEILRYIATIIQETRQHGQIYLGASPRAALALLKSSKVAALMAGRDFIIPDDIKHMAPHVLNHRLILTPSAEIEGATTLSVLDEITKSVEVPR